jgi:hypothetical protein
MKGSYQKFYYLSKAIEDNKAAVRTMHGPQLAALLSKTLGYEVTVAEVRVALKTMGIFENSAIARESKKASMEVQYTKQAANDIKYLAQVVKYLMETANLPVPPRLDDVISHYKDF